MNNSKKCRHIFTDGHRCGSPSLRTQEFCYYHHTTRHQAAAPNRSRGGKVHFDVRRPEDRISIQHAIGDILQLIGANEIDLKRASLVLYGLSIASSNLARIAEPARAEAQVEDIVTHPDHGTIAPADHPADEARELAARPILPPTPTYGQTRYPRDNDSYEQLIREEQERRENHSAPHSAVGHIHYPNYAPGLTQSPDLTQPQSIL